MEVDFFCAGRELERFLGFYVEFSRVFDEANVWRLMSCLSLSLSLFFYFFIYYLFIFFFFGINRNDFSLRLLCFKFWDILGFGAFFFLDAVLKTCIVYFPFLRLMTFGCGSELCVVLRYFFYRVVILVSICRLIWCWKLEVIICLFCLLLLLLFFES